MKRFLIAAALAAATITTPALAADVGMSLSIGQPGFYGQIDIGDYPRPEVIYSRPMMVERVDIDRPPIYLRVPPGHAKNWRKHCGQYNACGERVMFVKDNWYQREYVPRYHEQHREHRDDRRDERRDERRDDNRANQQNDHQGNGHGRGR